MLRLDRVSKYYYNHGVISSGIHNLDIEFDLGEFVAIIGESGSGKSTLLNVIAGLDSYEEGELYINGGETSHYSQQDFENYRKRYVGNIYQTFNLVNSYSVFKNIELVCLLNGRSKRSVKKRILEIIDKVGLLKFKNTRVSKLSGGQKQRVAIARVLAMDVPVILADEATGNLDKAQSEEIIKLLHEISKDKLVICVTHNYELVKPYATRRVTMSDGKVIEDVQLKPTEKVEKYTSTKLGKLSIFNRLRLAIRNTFNLIGKFILGFLVFAILISGATAIFGTYLSSQGAMDNYVYSAYFAGYSDNRIIVKKSDDTIFTSEELESFSSDSRIKKVVKSDFMLDSNFDGTLTDGTYISGFYGLLETVDQTELIGRMPENENEIVISPIATNDGMYYVEGEMGTTSTEETDYNVYLNQAVQMTTWNYNLSEYIFSKYEDLLIVGVIPPSSTQNSTILYVNDVLLDRLQLPYNRASASVVTTVNKVNYYSMQYSYDNNIVPSSKVPKGKVYVTDNLEYQCKKTNCKNEAISFSVSGDGFINKGDFKIGKVIKYKDIASYFVSNADYITSDILLNTYFVNTEDYQNLFGSTSTNQISIFVDNTENTKIAQDLMSELRTKGYNVLLTSDTVNSNFDSTFSLINGIITTIFILVLFVALFGISYFVLNLIQKSRNTYWATVRMLGGRIRDIRQMITIELFLTFNLAFIVVATVVYLLKDTQFYQDNLEATVVLYKKSDFVVLYILLLVVTLVLSRFISGKLFKKSALSVYREDV